MLECVTEKVEDSPLGKLVMSLRVFAAEVEREKIVERTTRGKLERAKSGSSLPDLNPATARDALGAVVRGRSRSWSAAGARLRYNVSITTRAPRRETALWRRE